VEADSGAAQAGLRDGDGILNWNGGEVPRRLERWVREQKPGDQVKLHIRREDKEVAVEFRLGETKETVYEVADDARANEKARRIREGLLRGQTTSSPVH
jgi:predicted metalloprotease with PDZ domain